MKGNIKSLHLLLITILFALVSCSTTTLTSVWQKESFKGPIDNVFVLGVAEKEVNRRIFEDEFSKQLSARGVNATASYRVFPSDEMLGKEEIEAKLDELNIETIIVTTIVDKERKVYRETWYPNYSQRYRYWHDEVRTIEYIDEIYHLQTSLYDVGSEGLVWVALSETVFMDDAMSRSSNKQIKSFINVMVKRLSNDGLMKQQRYKTGY